MCTEGKDVSHCEHRRSTEFVSKAKRTNLATIWIQDGASGILANPLTIITRRRGGAVVVAVAVAVAAVPAAAVPAAAVPAAVPAAAVAVAAVAAVAVAVAVAVVVVALDTF